MIDISQAADLIKEAAEEIKVNSPPPSVPERLPEEDAFLFACHYSDWIECYLTKRRDC